MADGSKRPACFIPLLGCGAPSGELFFPFGDQVAGSMVVRSFTAGPVLTQDVPNDMGEAMLPPGPFALPEAGPPAVSGTPREGPLGVGWWAAWNATLQDYRGFAPVHRSSCNLLFADGSVRCILDENRDGLLNNGFTTAAAPTSGFADDKIELPEEGMFSGWTMKSQ